MIILTALAALQTKCKPGQWAGGVYFSGGCINAANFQERKTPQGPALFKYIPLAKHIHTGHTLRKVAKNVAYCSVNGVILP